SGNSKDMSKQTTADAWRSPLRVSLVVFGVLISLVFFWLARSIVVTTFLGLLFAVTIIPAVDWLERFRIPRGAGAGLVVIVFLGVLVGIGALLEPVLQEQATELRRRLPEVIDRIDHEL